MTYLNFSEEKKLWRQGFNFVVGLDEVGRGPLAGPVIAAAVTVRQIPNSKSQIPKVNDSKKLSQKKREELYEILTNHSAIEWGVGIVSEKVIDKINILEATKLSMAKAIDNLISKSQFPLTHRASLRVHSKQTQNSNLRNLKQIDFLLIDGNFKITSGRPQKSIVKGDQKVFSIAAASIIAKVTRDRIMQRMHKKYPNYGFNLHKGYGTALHMTNLKNYKPCKIHRKTFFPVISFLN